MSYIVTTDTLPNFLAQISYLMRVNGKVICDIHNTMHDDLVVDQRRSEQSDPRDRVWQEMDKHPDRFTKLISK